MPDHNAAAGDFNPHGTVPASESTGATRGTAETVCNMLDGGLGIVELTFDILACF